MHVGEEEIWSPFALAKRSSHWLGAMGSSVVSIHFLIINHSFPITSLNSSQKHNMEYFYKFHSEPRTEKEREILYGRIRKIAFWYAFYPQSFFIKHNTLTGVDNSQRMVAIAFFFFAFHRLDSYFNIGGVKVGFEAIVGFIPVIGKVIPKELCFTMSVLLPSTLVKI